MDEPLHPNLHRTTSRDSTRSRRSSHSLVGSSSLSAPSGPAGSAAASSSAANNRKELYSGIDTARITGGQVVEKANLSMPGAPSSKLFVNPRSSNSYNPQRRPSSSYSRSSFSSHQRKPSENTIVTQYSQAVMASTLPDSSAIDDSQDTTSILEERRRGNISPTASLSDSTLQLPRSENDADGNRVSFSSIYQMGSALYDRARGAMASAPSSVAGSEPDSKFHHVSSSHGSLPCAHSIYLLLSINIHDIHIFLLCST